MLLIRICISKGEAMMDIHIKLKSLHCLQAFANSHLSNIRHLNMSRARNNQLPRLHCIFQGLSFCSQSSSTSSANTQVVRAKQMFWLLLVSPHDTLSSQLFSACRCCSFLPLSTPYYSPHTFLPDVSADSETPRFAHKTISELVWNLCFTVPTYDDDMPSKLCY